MGATKLIGIILIVAGALGLAYGGFSYSEETTAAKVGSVELKVDQQKDVTVPPWLGIGAIVIGGLLLLVGGRKG